MSILLEDYNLLQQYEVLAEDSDRGERIYKLRGVFSKCDVPNKNKRIYRRPIMEETVRSLQEVIKNGGFVGELDHPPTPKINMDKISHKITKLALTEDGTIVGEIIPAGPKRGDLISLMKDQIRMGVSTRGVGSVKPYNGPLGEGLLEVQPGYQMRAIDIVFDPSAGTYPEQVVESTDESNIMLAVPSTFKAIWHDVFGRK